MNSPSAAEERTVSIGTSARGHAQAVNMMSKLQKIVIPETGRGTYINVALADSKPSLRGNVQTLITVKALSS